jgi:uncharacterized protein
MIPLSDIDIGLLAMLAGWLCLALLFTLMALLSEKRAAWLAYPFLLIYWSFPAIMLEHTVLSPWALGLIALYVVTFPLLRILARRGVWGGRLRAIGLAIVAKSASWSHSGGGGSVSIRGISSFGSSSGSGSSGYGSSGSGYCGSSGGGRSSGSFSGGGGGFGGGGASGRW